MSGHQSNSLNAELPQSRHNSALDLTANARDYITAITDAGGPGAYGISYTKNGREGLPTSWHNYTGDPAEIDAMVADALARAPHGNVYLSVNPRKECLDIWRRGAEEDVLRSGVIPLELDIGGEGEPSTIDDAVRVMRSFPLRPGLLNASGSGVHGYVFLDVPVEGSTIREVTDAARQAFVTHVEECGYSAPDNVTEPSRVLRISNTINHKPGRNKARVTLLECRPDRTHSAKTIVASAPDPKIPPSSGISLPVSAIAGLTVGTAISSAHAGYGREAVEGGTSDVLAAVRPTGAVGGKRNATLYAKRRWCAEITLSCGLDPNAVDDMFQVAGEASGLRGSDARKTIASARRKGELSPLNPLDNHNGPQGPSGPPSKTRIATAERMRDAVCSPSYRERITTADRSFGSKRPGQGWETGQVIALAMIDLWELSNQPSEFFRCSAEAIERNTSFSESTIYRWLRRNATAGIIPRVEKGGTVDDGNGWLTIANAYNLLTLTNNVHGAGVPETTHVGSGLPTIALSVSSQTYAGGRRAHYLTIARLSPSDADAFVHWNSVCDRMTRRTPRNGAHPACVYSEFSPAKQACSGLYIAGGRFLIALREHPGSTALELAELQGCHVATAGRRLKRFIEAGVAEIVGYRATGRRPAAEYRLVAGVAIGKSGDLSTEVYKRTLEKIARRRLHRKAQLTMMNGGEATGRDGEFEDVTNGIADSQKAMEDRAPARWLGSYSEGGRRIAAVRLNETEIDQEAWALGAVSEIPAARVNKAHLERRSG